MRSLVEHFTKQIEESLKIGKKAVLSHAPNPITNVLINGMGGSGIGGTIVSELVSIKSEIPVYVSKSYFLPKYVNKNTLIIISSYSGNTEETIQSLETALDKGAKIVAISSGGKILEIARRYKIDHITIPGDIPPRAAIAYSVIQMLFVLNHFKIINSNFIDDLEETIELLKEEEKAIEEKAKQIASLLLGKIPVIYAPIRFEGVAIRFRQELNENAKMLGWSNVLPEMNHNEILGWSKKHENIAVIFFRNDDDYNRISKRIDLTKEVVLQYAGNVIEIYSKGNSLIERIFYSIHMGDWISLILAEMEKVDPDEIRMIENFKASLAGS